MREKRLKPKQMLRMLLDTAMINATHVEPQCKHFGECGGCEFEDIEYHAQAEAKRETFKELLKKKDLLNIIAPSTIDLVPSPKAYGYRQRMDYVYAFHKAGLRKRRSHKWVIELEECPLLGEKAFNTFKRAKELAIENNLISYNYLNHQGYLRYFVIRKTRSQEILISLVTKTRENSSEINSIAETLLAEGLATSVYWLLQDTMSDVSFGTPLQYWGNEFICETYLNKKFLIGPNTFFQANADVAEKAYTKIKNHITSSQPNFVIDMYSGTGIIAQLVAENTTKVIAVENITDNIKIAEQNIKNNSITNVELIEDDAFKYLAAFSENTQHIILNPPRVGLGDKACHEVCRISPKNISYMSCNPLTLLSDLSILKDFYTVTECTVYDMFPQTKHWETLVKLEKIE